MYASITLDVTAKSVNLINLDSAISYWGQPDEHLLNGMRDNGHVLGVEGVGFNVLSPTPIATLHDPNELE